MENNTASLKNNAATVLGGEVTDQKKLWWKQRETLNSAVENTMVRIENEWFKKVGLDTLLLCKDINEEAVFPPSSPSGEDVCSWFAFNVYVVSSKSDIYILISQIYHAMTLRTHHRCTVRVTERSFLDLLSLS